MFNLKLTIYGALFGLIISIFFGSVGGNQFSIILLRALISSLLCGGILALASFLFRRFLSDSTGDISSDTSTVSTNSGTGSVVDITIDEDVLPDSDNAPDFYVSKKFGENQFFERKASVSTETNNESKVAKVENLQTRNEIEKSGEQSFSPVKTSTDDSTSDTLDSSQKSQEFVPTSLVKEKYHSSDVSSVSINESLDSLPELGSFIPDTPAQESEVIEDSAFAKGESSSVELIPDVAVGTDTTLMAEAIKTLLRREG